MASINPYELDATIRKVKGTGMVNKLLQLICVGEGLNKYGVKADLQQKIIDSEFVARRYPPASSFPSCPPQLFPATNSLLATRTHTIPRAYSRIH